MRKLDQGTQEPKEGYTSEEIYQFWRESNPRLIHKIDVVDGLKLAEPNIIVAIKDRVFHNPMGPARIKVGPHTKKIITREYFIRGEKLEVGDVVYDMIRAREKKNTQEKMRWV